MKRRLFVCFLAMTMLLSLTACGAASKTAASSANSRPADTVSATEEKGYFDAETNGGYDDEGRDNLERVYADCFGTEAALVRPQITCGTHALALALCPKDVKHVWNLSVEEAAAYLKGQTFSAEGEKGWYLICVDGISLGWGKLAGGIMKNHYPKGLRKG